MAGMAKHSKLRSIAVVRCLQKEGLRGCRYLKIGVLFEKVSQLCNSFVYPAHTAVGATCAGIGSCLVGLIINYEAGQPSHSSFLKVLNQGVEAVCVLRS